MKSMPAIIGLFLAMLLVTVGCGQAEQSIDDAKKASEKVVNQDDGDNKVNGENDKGEDEDEDEENDKEDDKDDKDD